MERRLYILVFATLLVLGLIVYFFLQYRGEREAREIGLESLEVDFVVATFGDSELINTSVLRYTDATFLDLSINLFNRGGGEIYLRSPVLSLYLEGMPLAEKELNDQSIMAGSRETLTVKGLSFQTEVIDAALKGRTGTLEDVARLTGVLSYEYDFVIADYAVLTYWLNSTFEGNISLIRIFGGKSQEEAVVDILGLNRSTS